MSASQPAGCRHPATGPWFFEPDRVDAVDPAAASLAGDRTPAFVR